MSIATDNRVTELEGKVKILTEQMQQLTEVLRQVSDNKHLTSNPPKRKYTRHIQPQ